MNKGYLKEIVELFVVREKQSRFIEFIGSAKRYDDFLWELLNDPRNIKPECVSELPTTPIDPTKLTEKLRRLGAGTNAYLVSLNLDVDGKEGSLKEILSLVKGAGDLVYCVGSNLAYYEGHENWRWVLKAIT